MPQLLKILRDRLSVRLSLWVVTFVAILIVAALSVMYHFSHQAVKEEAVAKATLTLDGTVLIIDNVLIQVEVAARTMRWNVEHHLDDPEALHHYCRQLLEDNPILIGCALAMDSDFYHREFIIYTYRKNSSNEAAARQSEIIESDHYDATSYLQQTWFTIPMTSGEPAWVKPQEQGEYNVKPATYSIPIRDGEGRVRGILGLDISLNWFSSLINETKPFPNSYCSMIGRRGSYIVHPDTAKMNGHNVFERINGANRDTKMEMLLESMISGESGYREVNVDGRPCFVFYKPFRNKGWIAAIVCPKDELLGAADRLLMAVLAIAFLGLLALLLFCLIYIDRAVRPLSLLARTARRLSEGHYDDPLPDTKRLDEIGSLQNSFKAMQQSIANRIDEIRQVNSQLEESNAALQEASIRAKEADRTMNAFLNNLSDQLLQPAINIESIVSNVHEELLNMNRQEATELARKIHVETGIVTELLYQLLEVSQQKGGKP